MTISKIKFHILLLFLIAMPLAYSLEVYNANCYNDGHLELILIGNNVSKAYTKDINISYNGQNIEGSWSYQYIKKSDQGYEKYGTFTSKEGSLIGKKQYLLNINYILTENSTAMHRQALDATVDCPGLFFSCSMLNLSIEDCYNQGNKFTAIIKTQGLSQSPGTLMKPDEVISYTLKTKQTYLDVNNLQSKKGSLPKQYNITEYGDSKEKYLLQFELEDNFVDSLFVEFNNDLAVPCSREKYSKVKFYDLKSCGESPLEPIQQQEQPAKEEQQEILPETASQQNTTAEQMNTTDNKQQDSEELDSKYIIMLAIIVLIIGAIAIYLLKKRDISN